MPVAQLSTAQPTWRSHHFSRDLLDFGDVGESSLARYWNSLQVHLRDGIRRYRIRPGVLSTANAANPWAPEEIIDWNRTLLQSRNDDTGFDAYPLVEDRLSDILAEASSLAGESLLSRRSRSPLGTFTMPLRDSASQAQTPTTRFSWQMAITWVGRSTRSVRRREGLVGESEH